MNVFLTHRGIVRALSHDSGESSAYLHAFWLQSRLKLLLRCARSGWIMHKVLLWPAPMIAPLPAPHPQQPRPHQALSLPKSLILFSSPAVHSCMNKATNLAWICHLKLQHCPPCLQDAAHLPGKAHPLLLAK